MNSRSALAWRTFMTALFAALLTACGGGGGSDYVPPGEYTQGIWRGTVTLDGMNLGLVVGMIDDQGNANLILYAGDSQLSGTISSIGSEVNKSFSNLSLFAIGGDLSDVYGAVSGTVLAGSSLAATFSSAGGRMLELDLRFDSLYLRQASLSAIAGDWRYGESGYTIDWQIDASGALSGTDTNGCSYSGQVSVPNASHNLYKMRYEISACTINPVNVSGLAILDDTATTNDTLLSAGTGVVGLLNTNSFVERLRRQ